jgi:hypothetical protein
MDQPEDRPDGCSVSMYEYFLGRFKEMQEQLQALGEERWRGHEKVHEMGQIAIDSTVKAFETRLESMNQFRAQILEERANFLTTAVFNAEYKALESKMEIIVNANLKRIELLEHYKSNMDGRLWMLGTILGLMTIGLNVVFHYWK